MADESETVRCDADDPNRCQAMTKHGQCSFRALEGSKLCFRHCRNRQVIEQKKMNNYLLTTYYARAAELAESDNIKSLKDEIALLRMVLEKQLNSISSDSELLIATPQIGDLVTKIEKTVLTSHKLESQMGSLMGREEIVILCNNMVNIISENVDDASIVQRIAEQIGEKLESKVLV